MKKRTRDFRAWLVEAISCYDASAELFMPRRKGGPRRPIGYRRFATAAEAIRFAVEDFPPSARSVRGCRLEMSGSTATTSGACTRVATIRAAAARGS